MATVSGSPARLRRYPDALMAPDAALRDEVPALRAALVIYRNANPDFGQDHSHLADQLEVVIADSIALNTEVRVVAAALASLDAGVPAATPRHGSRMRFEAARGRVVGAWEQPDSLLELVVAMEHEDWVRHVLGGWRCSPGRGEYRGSGGLRGLDGRVYPLVIPELEIDGKVANIAYDPEPDRDPATLGGGDRGWRVIDERAGVARVEAYVPSWFDRGAVAAAMATGLQGPSHGTASREELQAIGFAADGRPLMGEQPAGPPHDPRDPFPADGPARPLPWLGHRSSPVRAVGVLDMVVGAADGVRVASQLENPGTNLYRAVFEEHEDGERRRVRLHTYQVTTTSQGSSFVPFMAYAVGDQLRRRPAIVAPPAGTRLGHGPGSGAGASGRRSVAKPLPAHRSGRRDAR